MEQTTVTVKQANEHNHVDVDGQIQNILIVWLDSSIHTNNPDCQNTITQLQQVVTDVHTFTDNDQCIEFILNTIDTKVCLIVSGSIGQDIVSCIHDISQIDSIFIFCGNKNQHEQWVKPWFKIKDVSIDITHICQELQQITRQYEHNAMPMSFVGSGKRLDQLDPSFINDRTVALSYAESNSEKSGLIGILFAMKIDPIQSTTPYASVGDINDIIAMDDFLAASFSSLVSLLFGLIPTFYLINNIYPGNYSVVFCKMQGYITHTSLQMTRVYLVLACFDRFALSSANANIRKFSTVIVARRCVPIVILSCYLVAMHLIIYLDIVNNSCAVYNLSALIYNSIYSITTISILMPLLMLIFSLLTFLNLKKRQKQREHINLGAIHRDIIRDKKVFFTLLGQLLLYFISTGLYAPNIIYTTITQNMSKSIDQQIISLFINAIALLLIYIYPGFSFLAFTLTSKTFRKELISLKTLFPFSCVRRRAVVPHATTTKRMNANNLTHNQTF
ncbi:hypothetical protein I4U23_004854 [Adineta vaga]|nr:hypothetical protein I4U23_004854 [Adineta vaga]